jgi:hypothetical protein
VGVHAPRGEVDLPADRGKLEAMVAGRGLFSGDWRLVGTKGSGRASEKHGLRNACHDADATVFIVRVGPPGRSK